ncbi:T9SS type A sorting domain-containing protein [Flammeovirga sp. EKP202]|uniref:T9SS type A sorting domain-containing protein n=1 Tax=Flammeovirga sp. EKP202 TaxID=2770592 RepID=UPI00165ED613|nr:T9SS type A sorting domain-containing protein [Flammeovirga sp. EKP202]MBD0403846.1 T9SS type A sorting domain-containing protein [Flammeovirga sp. EKP202]
MSKLRFLFIYCILLLNAFGIVHAQTSNSSLYLKGSALPNDLDILKLVNAGNSNYETILYATRDGEISFESKKGEQFGMSMDGVLSKGGASIPVDVDGDQSLFHIHVDLANMTYEITELKGLSVVTKFDKENSDWGTPMDLSYSYQNKVLTFDLPYSFLLQDRYKIVADADKELEWYGATVSNLSFSDQSGGMTVNGILTNFAFDYYYDLGIASISIDSERKHFVTGISTTSDNVIVLGTDYDNVGNKYVVGNCYDCGSDSLGYIQKNNGDKLLFSTTFQNKRGEFLQVSDDGEIITILVNNTTENGIDFNNINYTDTNEDQLVLFVLNNDLSVAYTKKVLRSSTLGLIKNDGYDLSIDSENNIYTQLYLADGEVTVNEVNETFDSDAIIQLTKWNASGAHQWSKNLTFYEVTDFEVSIMATDMSGNIYVVSDLATDGYQFDDNWGTYPVTNDLLSVKINTDFSFMIYTLFSRRNDEKASTIYSIKRGQEEVFVSGIFHKDEEISYYGDFKSENYDKAYFVASFNNERLDNVVSFYLDDPGLIKKDNISIEADSLENYYVSFNISSKVEVYMDRDYKTYINDFSQGINIFKFYGYNKFKGYGQLLFDGVNYTNLDLDLSNGIKVNGNLTESGSVIQNNQSIHSISSADKTLEIDFDLEPNTDFKEEHPIHSSKEITIEGTAITRNSLSLLNKKDNIFYGINYLKNEGGILFENDNGEKLSIDEQFNLIVSEMEYPLNGEGDYSTYYYTIDIFNKKASLHEITSVAYQPVVDGELGSSIEINTVEHHSDKGFIKYISEEITLEHEFYFMLNGDTTLLIGDEWNVDNRFPIRANKGLKAQLVFYMDYINGYFTYEILSDNISKINDVKFDSTYNYIAIESDVDQNIYRLGVDIESQSTSNLQKLNSAGEVLSSKTFSLGTIDVFGNNLKVDEATGNMILVLQNRDHARSFTFDGQDYVLESGSTSVIVYLDNELNILNYVDTVGISDDISVTTYNGKGYYAEFEHTNDMIYVHSLDADKKEEVTTFSVNMTGSYYIITLTADKEGLLYLSGEFQCSGISTVEEGELEAFKNREINAPLIAINSSDGSIKWAKALISGELGGGIGWPTGFQAGDSSVYITGWIYEADTLLEDHLVPNVEDIDVGTYSNFALKVDNDGNAVWSELLPYEYKYSFNFGYTRVLVDEDESLYYLLDIKSDITTSGQDVLYTTSNRETYNALIKYSKDGVREKVTPLRPVMTSLKDMVKVDDEVIITGGMTYQDRYFNYQDFKFINRDDEKVNYTLFVQDEYSFTSEPEDIYKEVTWNINMQPLIEVSLFDPEEDSLSILIKSPSSSIYRVVSTHEGNGIYNFSYSFTDESLTYELSVNGEKEEVQSVRTYTITEEENTIDVIYQFSNYQEFKEEHLVVEKIDEEAIEIKIDESLFTSLSGTEKKFLLMQKNGDAVPDYVVFDQETLTITIDVTKLPSGTRVKAIEDLNLVLVGNDELQNTVAVEIILTLDEYLKDIDGDITSIDDELKKYIKVFPTKTEGVINIHTSLKGYEVAVYDINGKLLHSEIADLNTSIKTENFSSGMLIIKVKSNVGSFNYKVLK